MKQNNSKLFLRSGKLWLYAMFLFASSLTSEWANAQRCDLVVNGSFTQQVGCPQATFTSDYQCKAVAPVGNAGYAIATNAAQWNGPWYGTDQFGAGGNFLIVDGRAGAGGTRIWIQNVNVVAGRTYTFTASAKNIVNPRSGAGQDAVNPTVSLRANGAIVATSIPLVQTAAANTWTQVSGTYVATTTGIISIDVTQNINNGYNDVGIDNLTFEYDMPTPTVNSAVICDGKTATFTASGATNGEVYEWYASSTRQDLLFTGNPFVTPVLNSTTVYWVAIKAAGTCSLNRIPATATVITVSTPGPIADQIVCKGSSAILTGNGAVAGEVYEWYTNATGGSPVYSSANPVTTGILNASVTYWMGIRNAGCRSSRVQANIIVNPTPALPIIADQITICSGTQATLTASGASVGDVYEWYTSPNGPAVAFTGNPFVTPVINSPATYYVSIKNSQGCKGPRKKITIHLNQTPAAPVVHNVTICGPASTSLTAPGGGTIKWYTSATSSNPFFTGATLNTPVLAATTSYWVSKTNPNGCESPKAEVTVTVNLRPNAPITANASRCGCGSVLLQASGSTGTYSWYTSAAGGTPVFQGPNFATPNLCNTTNYWVSSILNGCESPRVQATAIINVIDLVINGNFALPTGCPQPTFGSDYRCDAAPALDGTGFFAITNNPAPWNRNLWWGADRTGGTNFLIADGANIGNNRLWFQQVNVVAGQQYEYTAWTKNIVNPNTVSNGIGSSITLNVNGATIANSGLLPTTATANAWTRVSALYTATASGFVTLDIRHILNGFSDIAIDDISFVRVVPTPKVTNQVICAGNKATLFASGGAPADAYDWYTTAIGGTPVFTGNPYVTPVLNATTDYWVAIRIPNGCTSARVQVKVTVNPVPPAPTVTDVTLCGPVSATLTATGGPILTWYPTATGGTPLFTGATYVTPVLNANTSYWVSASNAQGCASPRVQVNVTINPRPEAPVTTNGRRCGCGSVLLTASGSTGTFNWYATPNGGAVLFTGTDFNTPNICSTTNYYVTAVSDQGCESARVIATATVGFPVTAINLVQNGTFALPNACPQTGFTYDYTCDPAAPINGTGSLALTNNAATWNGPWWGVNRLADGTNFLIADGTNNVNRRIWIQSVNVVAGQQYTFSIWARNLVNPGSGAGADSGPGTVSLRVNNVVLTTSPVLVQTAAAVWTQVSAIYTATTTGSITLDVFQNTTNNGYNDVGIDDIIFVGRPPVPVVNNVTSCAGNAATLTASGAPAGSTYAWYTSAAGGVAVFVGNPYVTPVLATTTTYWVAIRDVNGCETDRVPAVVTINPNPVVNSTTDATRCDCGVLSLTATGDAGTYNWYDAATGGNLVGTGNNFTTPSLCNTTTYYVSVTNATGCVSQRKPATASITGPAVTLTGLTQVYANAIVQYTLTIANNSGAAMNGIVINPSLPGFTLDATLPTNPFPAGPYSIAAGGAPLVVTYQGYFATTGVPQTLCFDVVANGCTTTVCKNITNVYAGCPFSYSAITTDCDHENYGPAGVIKTISLSGHANVFDVTSVDYNMTYNPSYLALVSSDIIAGAPAGTTVTAVSTPNPNGTITINGTVTFGSQVDILHSNGDGDIVVNQLVNTQFRILARPLNTCDMQLPTTGTTFHSTSAGTLSKPTDLARFVFLCTPCPAISAFFTASPNPVLQGATVVFTADPTTGAHTWYSGENNDRQLGNTSPVAPYVYKTPGVYTVTHYRTENGLTGIYSQDITVCGITTNAIAGSPICAGSTVNVPFTASACSGFQAGNVFTAQLSDANGSFANPVAIGSLTATASGQIVATIPFSTVAGNGYRIRVVSTSPALAGTDNGVDKIINTCNSAALVFDGTNDRVTIPHHAAYNVGSGNFTLEALVNIPVGANSSNPIFSKRTSGSDGFLVYSYGTQLLLQMNGVPNYQSGSYATINDGRCHHIAISRSGTTITFYIDGSPVGSVIAARSLNSAGPLYLGYDAVDNSYFKGTMNEVRFWNTSRTAAEISANANALLIANPAGLIGLWSFNETNQPVVDASATSNNGVLGSNNTVETSDPTRTTVQCNSVNRQEATGEEVTYTENTSLSISASPNPFTAQTIVSIKGLTSEGTYHVEVYTMHGLLALSKEVSATEDIVLGNELAAGMYLIKVTENGTSQTLKIIKE